MGLSRGAVYQWEHGQGITRGNLFSFAQVANVSAEWLMIGEPNLAPLGEKASDQTSVLEVNAAQLERLIVAVFELQGTPPHQSEELAKAILRASMYSRSDAQELPDGPLTKRLAQFLIRMYAP
jgi:transcriptional regulator with XRE-family HTH domain